MTWCSRNNAVPGFFLASSAIRCRFVDRFVGSMPPPVFPTQRFSPHGASLPSFGSWQAQFPALSGTMKALRLPTRASTVAHWFAPAAHAIPPHSCSPWRSRKVGGPFQAGGFDCTGCPKLRFSHVDANGMSQVFRRSFLCLCSAPGPRSNRRVLAMSVTSMPPPLVGRRRLRQGLISGLTRSFGTCCHTLHADVAAHVQGLLPAGWLAFAGWASNPLDRYQRFQLVLTIIHPSCSPDATILRPSRRLADLARLEHVGRVAELAGHRDLAVLDHVVAVVLRKAAQHPFDPRPRARALRVQVPAAEHPYPALVEQPVEQLLGRDLRIEQLDVLDGGDERAPLDPGIVLRRHLDLDPLRHVAGIEVGLARPLRRPRQELQQEPAGAPPMPGAVRPRPHFLGHGEAHAGRDLLGAEKILVRGMLEILALERDDALVAGGVRALVDGHGQMAMAEQRAGIGGAGGDRGGHPVGIEAGAAAHLAGRGVVDDQHPHRAVALRLQDEAAFELQRRAEQHREHDALAQQLGDGRRIAMARKNGIDGGPEADHAPAQVERLDLERQDGVVCGSLRRRACRNLGFVHETRYRGDGRDFDPLPFDFRRQSLRRESDARAGAKVGEDAANFRNLASEGNRRAVPRKFPKNWRRYFLTRTGSGGVLPSGTPTRPAISTDETIT